MKMKIDVDFTYKSVDLRPKVKKVIDSILLQDFWIFF